MNEKYETPAGSADCLLHALLVAGHMVEDQLNSALEPHGLSLAKFAVLAELTAAHEPVPLGALSEHLGCVKSNVTQLVDRLESERLVQRQHDPEDRRSVRAAMTDEGRGRFEAASRSLAHAEARLAALLSAEERNQLQSTLGRFGTL